jgi:hypothetical protein
MRWSFFHLFAACLSSRIFLKAWIRRRRKYYNGEWISMCPRTSAYLLLLPLHLRTGRRYSSTLWQKYKASGMKYRQKADVVWRSFAKMLNLNQRRAGRSFLRASQRGNEVSRFAPATNELPAYKDQGQLYAVNYESALAAIDNQTSQSTSCESSQHGFWRTQF